MIDQGQGRDGRYFEDFAVGDVYRCRHGRTITETENIQFTLLTNNTNPLHFDREYATNTEWGRCLVNSLLTLSIVVGMTVSDVSQHGFALGFDNVRLTSPVFPGDTLYSESEVLETRASKSRRGQGIVRVAVRGFNQAGLKVIELERSVMVWQRSHAQHRDNFPASD
jgi:itaconyl-CoA hydratase